MIDLGGVRALPRISWQKQRTDSILRTQTCDSTMAAIVARAILTADRLHPADSTTVVIIARGIK